MDPEDEARLAELKKEFDDVAVFIESDFKGNCWNKKFINMYAVVYNAATRPKVIQVHEHYKVQAELYEYCRTILTDYFRQYPIATNETGDKLFHDVIRRWAHYKLILRWVEKTFRYLSRFYVVHCNVPPLEELGLSIFFVMVFDEVTKRIASTLLSMLNRERNGELVDSTELQLATELFVKMSAVQPIYRDELAIPVINQTAEFYRKEAALWLATDSTTTYLEKAESCLGAEQRRCARYFLKSTETEIMQRVEWELLGVHQDALLTKENSGFVALVRDLRTDHLHRMYTLFDRLPKGLEPMGRLLREQCLAEANEVVKRHSGVADANFQGYVADFIALHEKYVKILNEQLDSNAVFQKALKDAFENGLNQGLTGDGNVKIHCTELLSNYCDMLLRGTEKLDETELDRRFDGFVSLFAHVSEKDMFQAHARRHLCRRLLTSTSSEETEKMLITKLKAKCGATFTGHFEGMINDRNVSLEQQNDFTSFATRACSGTLPYEFTTLVLTSGFWPKQPTDELILPQEAKRMYEVFQTYYHEKTRHRVLVWTNANATATLVARYSSVPREFQMTAFQACVLLMFNSRDVYSAGELAKELQLDWDDLKRILPSFTKLRILTRSGDSPALKESDVFKYNPEFTSSHRKMKIPLTQPRIVATQSAQVRSVVEEDRKPAIDACLVRIMKSRKQLDHSNLVSECMSQLSSKFQPDPKLIKRRIEDLIDRDFLERVPDLTPSAYRYLA